MCPFINYTVFKVILIHTDHRRRISSLFILFLFVRANALRTWEAFSKGRNEKYFLVLVLTQSLTRSGFVARRVVPDFLWEPSWHHAFFVGQSEAPVWGAWRLRPSVTRRV